MSAEHEIPDGFTFIAYFEGKGTPEERAAMERWMQASAQNAAAARAFRIMWQAHQRPVTAETNRAAAIERVMASIRGAETSAHGSAAMPRMALEFSGMRRREAAGMAGTATVKKLFRARPRRDPGQHSLFRTVGFGIAAGAVFLLGAGIARMSGLLHIGGPQASLTESPMREMVTHKSQRAEMRLADGTRVVLGVDSKLRIPATFGHGVRDVYLDGEAYFEVTHDTARPFHVRTSHGTATDLGTRFDVRAYTDDTAMTVVVGEGAVALHGMTLVAGDLGRISAHAPYTTKERVDASQYFAWTEGRLVFHATPLADALRQLERWYDVTIRLDGSTVSAGHLSGSYRDETITEVMQNVALAFHLRAERHGRTITFTRIAP